MIRLVRTCALVLIFVIAGTCHVSAAAEVPVAISVRAYLEDGTLQIRGKATVRGGAWIMYAAYPVADPQTRATGYTQVEDEEFAVRLDVSSWPAGEIAVDAHFQVLLPGRKQPDAVVARRAERRAHERRECDRGWNGLSCRDRLYESDEAR